MISILCYIFPEDKIDFMNTCEYHGNKIYAELASETPDHHENIDDVEKFHVKFVVFKHENTKL